MNRREFLSGIASASGVLAMPQVTRAMAPVDAASSANQQLPNVVFFLVDDLGWGDFSCYGDSFHETPNIDRLAADGMKFNQAYAAAPVCSPSRAGIMTGQHPARLHLTQWIPGVKYPHKKLLEAPSATHLPAGVPTLATEFKRLGYQTAAIGKWHLGGEGFLPEDFGFDVNIAGDDNGHPPPPNNYFGPWHFHHLTGYTQTDELTEVLTEKMEQFLDSTIKKGPFFLYMAEYAVHLPLQERQALIEKYRQKNKGEKEPDPIYAAMVESVDTALAKLRAKLNTLGVADNTIIILTSDNGGVGFQGRNLHRIADNGPFRAGKGFLYEGGIREPLIIHWPGVTRPSSICDVPVIGTDFLPTLLSMIHGGQAPQPCDGVDFSPLLHGNSVPPHKELYWHYPHYSDQGGTPSGAVLDGDWKLIEMFEDGHLELYNLVVDPGELYNLASSYADKAAELLAKLRAWRTSVNAAMPQPNPEYSETLAHVRIGPPGCSWDPVGPCLED
jgi:arylsulfatase A